MGVDCEGIGEEIRVLIFGKTIRVYIGGSGGGGSSTGDGGTGSSSLGEGPPGQGH